MSETVFYYSRLGRIHYPLVPVVWHHGGRTIATRALVDSGASISTFSPSLAAAIGYDYRKGIKVRPAVVGGRVTAYENRITLEIAGVRFRCPVLIPHGVEVRFNLLGRVGIFSRFRIIFDEKEKRVFFRKR